MNIGFRVRSSRWLGTLALIAGLVIGGLSILLPATTVLATPTSITLSDSDCPSGTMSQSAFQSDLDQYSEIDYYGSNPCTINLTSSLTISGGVTQTINGGGSGLIFVGDAQPTANPPVAGTFSDFSIDDGTNASTLALQNVTVENGYAGIYGANSTIDIDQSTIRGNGVGNFFDGVYALNVNLTRSTVNNNSYGVLVLGNANVVNSTIANNLYDGVETGGSTTVTSSTISGNELGLYTSGATTVTATILDNNEDCDIRGAFTDGGYNLSTNPTCIGGNTSWPVASPSDLNLQPLGDYDGPTQTVALGPGSVAIDVIPAATCEAYTYPNDIFYSDNTAITTDQRGEDRPQGAGCEVGSYEAPSVNVATTPASPDPTTGWFNASTLGGYNEQATVQLTVTGTASYDWFRCGSTLLNYGLGGLNQSHTFPQVTVGAGGDYPDGSYAINGSNLGCTVSQGLSYNSATPLGFSITGLSSINVDTVAPTINSPVDGTTYTIDSTMPLSCADATSGIATCQVTVTPPSGPPLVVSQGQNLPTSQPGTYTVTPNTVTDNAGNQDTTALSYTVTGYPLVTLPGNTPYVRQGYYALVRVTFMNGNQDIASRTLPVASVSLAGPQESPNPQSIPFVHQLQYGVFSGKPGYQLSLNTRNLARGTWTLNLQLGGPNPQTAQVTFTIY